MAKQRRGEKKKGKNMWKSESSWKSVKRKLMKGRAEKFRGWNLRCWGKRRVKCIMNLTLLCAVLFLTGYGDESR